MANPTEIYVENNIGTVTCTDMSPEEYHLLWNFGDIFSNVNEVENVSEVTHDYTPSAEISPQQGAAHFLIWYCIQATR